MSEKELTTEEWKAEKKRKKAIFTQMQNLPFEAKKEKAKLRIFEFYNEMEKRDLNCHVSVGGLDSITLFLYIKSLGLEVEGITVSNIEDKSIQKIHRALHLTRLKSLKSKKKILQEHGFPVLSKKLAGRINTLQNPTPNNRTVRHAIISGECGEQGHFAKNSRMQLPKKWLKKFGGADEEGKALGYDAADFKVSNECCYWIKELPCEKWAKEHNSKPFLGLMASEGGQREEALIENGCNYYGKTVIRSAPFAIFMRTDLLKLTLEMDKLWKEKLRDEYWELVKDEWDFEAWGEFPDSIIPNIYGEIKEYPNGELYTTGEQRTGCEMCGFGIQLESRPHRFDRLRERDYKTWEYYMYRCVKDEETGEIYGWGKVLDYIGVGWEDIPPVQMNLFDGGILDA